MVPLWVAIIVNLMAYIFGTVIGIIIGHAIGVSKREIRNGSY